MNKWQWVILFLLVTSAGILSAFAINFFINNQSSRNIATEKTVVRLPTKPPSQSIPKTINLVSDIATVSASFNNPLDVTALLNEVDFWKKEVVTLYKPSGLQVKRIEVGPLFVHITDKPQSLGKVVSIRKDGSEYFYQGFGMSYDELSYKLDLFLFVHPAIIKSESEEALGQRFSSELLSAIFDITHPLLPEHKSFEERLVGKDDFMKKLFSMPNRTVIKISKQQ